METTFANKIPTPTRVTFRGASFWADCSRCGLGSLPRTDAVRDPRGPGYRIGHAPRTTFVDAFSIRGAPKNFRPGTFLLVQCATCGDFVPGRMTTCCESHAEKPREECGAACLAGRRSCSCKCEGRCHGAGVCLCTPKVSR